MIGFALVASAQQAQSVIGLSVDFVTGGRNNQAGSDGPTAGKQLDVFYSIYPSLRLTSMGAHSALNASYTFAGDRSESEPEFRSYAHQGSMSLTKTLSPNWTVGISDSFQIASDATTFNAIRG